MRLADSFRSERFGAVRIHELQRVIELDSGTSAAGAGSRIVPAEALRAIESEMVLVVPCMNETRGVIEGVLSGIPHDCLIVLVSNSDRHPVDRYEIEAQTVEQFCRLAGRPAMTVHQRDPGVAAAFKAAGMPELLDDDGLVRSGKGEAMLIGMALAAMTGRRHIGYVDADNYVPGSVHEYCQAWIETRNPHFHDNKGEEHVQGMRMQALNALYHSPVTLPAVRQAIVDFMVTQGALGVGEEPPRERTYPPVGTLDLDLLYDALHAEALSFRQPDGQAGAGLTPEPPVVRAAIPRRAA
jgi:hypothetical protein